MTLDSVKKTFERLGQEDPLYGVLAHKGTRHNRWDPDEFFASGQQEIRDVLRYLNDLGLRIAGGRALDFGCGVGRLSQALAERFNEVVGVDIAESMVRRAREYNQYGDRVEYRVNAADNLRLLDDDSFNFVYSYITLQHIPPEPAKSYLREFFRVLRPDGVAVFQVPNGKPYEPRSFGALLYTARRRHLRRIWKVVRGRPPWEMHYIPREQVEEIVKESGADLIDVVEFGKGRRRAANLRYCAVKKEVLEA